MPNITFGRWNPTEVLERRLDNDWPSPTPYATNLVTPTSISSTGTGNSSSIGANGSVTFSSCATLSLNGVFTSDFDNYMIVIRASAAALTSIDARLRASGTDNSTASSYVRQRLEAYATTVAGDRNTGNIWSSIAYSDSVRRAGFVFFLYGPYLTQPTAIRSVNVYDFDNAAILDGAGTHNQSTAYDGMTFSATSSTISGLVSVYGLGV